MPKHRAPRYVRTKKALAKAPVAAGAGVAGLGVLSTPANAGTLPVTHNTPHTTAGAVATAPATTKTHAAGTSVADSYGRHAAPEGQYTVLPGDTLTGIAAAHSQQWRQLYQRNARVIGADPDLIVPGEVFSLTGAPVARRAPAHVPTRVPASAPAPARAAAPAPHAGAPAAVATVTNSAGPVKPQAQAAADAVVSNVPGAAGITLGGTRASAVDPHGHPSGLAIDYMVLSDAALGDAIARFSVAHWDELGVEYVIWQQRILTSPGGSWQPMEDRGSATANHFDHVHMNYRG